MTNHAHVVVIPTRANSPARSVPAALTAVRQFAEQFAPEAHL
jgi:hypothetical protein